MVTRQDYPSTEVDAGLSVIIELMTLLAEYNECIVVVGGWVPFFLFGDADPPHTGSLDIDLALDMSSISADRYATILRLLTSRGYVQSGEQPFIFHRTVPRQDGSEMIVEVDLLAPEYGGSGVSRRTQQIQDVKARKARGCDLAFDGPVPTTIRHAMPDGAVNEITVNVAGVVPFLVMKGMVIWSRLKEKDAYDIYFTISQYRGRLNELVDAFKPRLGNRLVQEGLAKIRAKFAAIDSLGPVWTMIFLGAGDDAERDRIQRDAFELVNAFLDALGVGPFTPVEQ